MMDSASESQFPLPASLHITNSMETESVQTPTSQTQIDPVNHTTITQESNSHKELPVKRDHRYVHSDTGPYFVSIKQPGQALGHMHPMKVGQWLFRQNYDVQYINKVSKFQIDVHFKTYSAANTFLNSDFDSVHHTESFIPAYAIYSSGVIRGVETSITTEEIQLDTYVPEGFKITNVYRFNKKTVDDQGSPSYIPTETIKITFRSQRLPRAVILYHQHCSIEPYHERTRLCTKCGKLNHIAKFCRSSPKCLQCGQDTSG